jgi:hypothetical protein
VLRIVRPVCWEQGGGGVKVTSLASGDRWWPTVCISAKLARGWSAGLTGALSGFLRHRSIVSAAFSDGGLNVRYWVVSCRSD